MPRRCALRFIIACRSGLCGAWLASDAMTQAFCTDPGREPGDAHTATHILFFIPNLRLNSRAARHTKQPLNCAPLGPTSLPRRAPRWCTSRAAGTGTVLSHLAFPGTGLPAPRAAPGKARPGKKSDNRPPAECRHLWRLNPARTPRNMPRRHVPTSKPRYPGLRTGLIASLSRHR